MRGLVVAGTVALGACTLTTSLDGLSGGALDAGPRVDATAPVDASADVHPFDDAPDDRAVPQDAAGEGFVSTYRAVVLSDAPVVYYRLGDTGAGAKDEIGGHNGTVIGTLAHGPGAIAGDPDGALVGTGQGWIDIAQIYPFTGNASYSIEAWIAPQPASTLTGVLSRNLATPGNPPTDGYSLYIESPSLAPTMGRWLSNTEQAATGSALPAGTFSHVVGTYDGATLRVYVNGALSASGPSTQALIAPPTDLAIGATRNGTYGYFVGSIDEVALYDKALPAARIAAHHSAGLGM